MSDLVTDRTLEFVPGVIGDISTGFLVITDESQDERFQACLSFSFIAEQLNSPVWEGVERAFTESRALGEACLRKVGGHNPKCNKHLDYSFPLDRQVHGFLGGLQVSRQPKAHTLPFSRPPTSLPQLQSPCWCKGRLWGVPGYADEYHQLQDG